MGLFYCDLPYPSDSSLSKQNIYCATKPPSTAIACPVTNEASSEHIHTTALAISSGCPNRPTGSKSVNCSIVSFSLPVILSIMGICITPGHTAFTRIPSLAHSNADVFVNPMTPCFDATYAGRPANPTNPATEEQLTITPLPC